MNMHNPAHPGELLAGWLDDLSQSVTAFAAHIGISRVMLSRVLCKLQPVGWIMSCRLRIDYMKKPADLAINGFSFGAGEMNRTPDLLITNV